MNYSAKEVAKMSEQAYKNILVPVDGSKAAEKAFDRGIEVAKANHAHLDLLNVIDMRQFTVNFAGMSDVDGDTVYQAFEDINEYLQGLKQHANEAGLKDIDIHVRYGSPRTVIAKDFIKDYKNDLIIMGPTGLNYVERFLVGSVTDYVTRMAPCDVVIAK